MLKHGRAGIPMEVMGLMLGDFVDDYTVRVVDVFAMPQNGTVRAALGLLPLDLPRNRHAFRCPSLLCRCRA